MIIYYLIIILFLFIFTTTENFSYFNLNLDLNVPISHNNEKFLYETVNYSGCKYDLPQNIQKNIFSNRIKLMNIANYEYINDITTTNLLDSSNCCLVQKEFNEGNFNYKYTPLKNDFCNINLYELDHNNKLLFDNVNNWNNNNCKNNSTVLGSCRKTNMECIDFVTEDECKNIKKSAKNDLIGNNTIWSNKTCNNWN